MLSTLARDCALRFRNGQYRYHPETGPVRIVKVQQRLNEFVAVSTGQDPGKKVWHVEDLDERGWSRPHRGKKGLSDLELVRVRRLRSSGMTQTEIAGEIGCSRAVIGRVLLGVPKGPGYKGSRLPVTDQDDIDEIRVLAGQGWRNSVIANWIGCHEETVRKYAGMCHNGQDETAKKRMRG